MKALGIVGSSGSGKTTLIEKLIPIFVGRGLRVSTVKLTHHDLDLDQPGKDSRRHREAGAREVALIGPKRMQVFHEGTMGLPDALARLEPVDLVLVEGFVEAAILKIEVFRHATGKPLRARHRGDLVAVAADAPIADLHCPILPLNDGVAIADFILDRVM